MRALFAAMYLAGTVLNLLAVLVLGGYGSDDTAVVAPLGIALLLFGLAGEWIRRRRSYTES